MTKFSFEFFPPKSLDAAFRLAETAASLSQFDPEFVSVTYGAGGTTRALTHDAVIALHKNFGLNVAAHLTCVNATRADTIAIAQDYAKNGVNEIVALRGDPPNGAANFTPQKDGFANSIELVEALAELGSFNIRVSAYPESHPDAASASANIDWLKAKLDAGATSAITQFFFEASTFLRFRDACAAAGITQEIVPGILPVENWKNARAFAKRCGAKVPADLDRAFETAIRDDRHDLLAIAQCTELCSDLIDEGVERLHFYTLNRPALTREVLCALGHTPKATIRQVA